MYLLGIFHSDSENSVVNSDVNNREYHHLNHLADMNLFCQHPFINTKIKRTWRYQVLSFLWVSSTNNKKDKWHGDFKTCHDNVLHLSVLKELRISQVR